MELKDLTKNEKSLLLYLETRAVDHGGLVDIRQMNDEDVDTAMRWDKEVFVQYGRVCAADVQRLGSMRRKLTNWCLLSPKAWQLAHEERRARAERMWDKRSWQTTLEKRGG